MQILSPKTRTAAPQDPNQHRKTPQPAPRRQPEPEEEFPIEIPASEKKSFRGVIIAIFIFVICAWGIRKMAGVNPSMPGYHTWVYTPEKYTNLLTDLKSEKESLAEDYAEGNATEKKAVLEKARVAFKNSIEEELFPYWYGTKWAFHGTSQVPGQGKIACGYFVTTILRDAGCQIDRSGLAQAPSEEMIKTLTSESHIKRYSGTDIKPFVKSVKESGDGLYVVGLDTHTGFLSCDHGEVTFIHSGGSCVVREKALKSRALKRSNYRVIGKISDDDEFLKQWLGV